MKALTEELNLLWTTHAAKAALLRERMRERWNAKIGYEFQFQQGDWVWMSKENTSAIRNK